MKEEFPMAELQEIRKRLQADRLSKQDIEKLTKLVLTIDSASRSLRAAMVE